MFLTVEEAIEYMQSGNARFALKSHVTNNTYHYWMKENASGKAFYVYLIATTGELAFIGSIVNGSFVRGDHTKVSPQAPAYKAFEWIWGQLSRYRLPPDIEITPIEFGGSDDRKKTKQA